MRVVIFPTRGYHLNEEQFTALAKTNTILYGQNEFYVAQIEAKYPTGSFVDNWYWECLNSTYVEYEKIPVNLEASIFSVDGTWGFLISHENHALLGCTQEFWDEFKKQYPRWAEDYKEFIKYWRHWDNYRKQHMDKSAKNKWLSAFLDGLTVKPE